MVCGSASASTSKPRSRAVAEVTGPMETTIGCGIGNRTEEIAEVGDCRGRRERDRVDGTGSHTLHVGGDRARPESFGTPRARRPRSPCPQVLRARRRARRRHAEEDALPQLARRRKRFEQRLGDEALGNQVGAQASSRERVRSAGTDCGDASVRQGARVETSGCEATIEERVDPVRRREHHPAVIGEIRKREIDRLDRDRGQLDDLGAELFQPVSQLTGLLARACHDDRATEQRTILEPGEVEAGDLADDDGRGRFDAGIRDRRERRPQCALLRPGSPADHRDRCLGGATTARSAHGRSRRCDRRP